MSDLDKEPLEQTLDRLITQFDEWLAMANDPETFAAIKTEEIAFSQVTLRAHLLTSYLRPKLKVAHG